MLKYLLTYASFNRKLADWVQAPKLPVRENDVGQVFVANLTSIPITSIEEFVAIYSYVLFVISALFEAVLRAQLFAAKHPSIAQWAPQILTMPPLVPTRC
jgi:hypothetical protein